jgi:hypothetical protein
MRTDFDLPCGAKCRLLERGAELYSQKQVSEQTSDANIPMLQRKIGELTMQIDFLKKALGQ